MTTPVPGPPVPGPPVPGPPRPAAPTAAAATPTDAVPAEVTQALARLDELDGRPVTEHVEVFDGVHRLLQDALATLDEA